MAYVIDCQDGMQVRGETMEELRANTAQHIAEHHEGQDLDLDAVVATARTEWLLTSTGKLRVEPDRRSASHPA
jgi:hypothetical protein